VKPCEIRVGLRVGHLHLTKFSGRITAIHNRGRCSVKWSGSRHPRDRNHVPPRVCKATQLTATIVDQLAALPRDSS